MSNRKRKKVPFAREPATKKQPVHEKVTNWFSIPPVWRVGNMDMDGPYGWQNLDRETLLSIKEKLSNFETMTLNDIFRRASRQNHSSHPHQLTQEARERLQALRLYDVDTLYSLRLAAKPRVWGFITENVFHLLWWDPDHLVRPAEKKHT